MQKILIILFFSISIFAKGQVRFQKIFGETTAASAQAVQQTIDGGYILTGQSGIGTFDDCLIKTDSIGNVIWTKSYDTGAEDDDAFSVQQTSDGGFIVAGQAWFNNPFIHIYIYLLKTNSVGDTLWTKFFYKWGGEFPYSVQQTNDGGYIIAGSITDTVNFSDDIYIIKTDSLGNLIWSKAYGEIDSDFSGCVQQTPDGGFIVAGYITISGTGYYISLLKIDSNGNLIWTKSYDGYANNINGYSVKLTRDGGYIIGCGTVDFGAGGNDAYLIKTDSAGNVLWSKTYGGLSFDVGTSAQQTADGGYIMTGYSYSFSFDSACDVYIVKTDSIGNLMWSKHYGGMYEDYAWSVQQTNDLGFIITGWTNGLGIAGWSDVYIIKTDSNGFSGCNEDTAATIVNSITTQVLSPTIISSNPGTIVSNTNTNIIAIGTDLTLCIDVTAIELEKRHYISIFPNPFHTTATFHISDAGIKNAELKIYNTIGSLVRSEKIPNITSYTLHRGDLNNGLYFYELQTSDNELLGSGKFVIE